MRPAALLVGLLVLAAPAGAAQNGKAWTEISDAQLCYAQRDMTAEPREFCRGISFHESQGEVLESDLMRRHLRLEHGEVPGFRPAGIYDYQVDPAYLLEAVAIGDTVHFVVESRDGHIVDVWPLLSER